MNRLLLVLMLIPSLLLAQDNPNYDPDFDGDGCYSVADILGLLPLFGECIGNDSISDGIAVMDNPNYDPDFNNDSCFTVMDILELLPLLGSCAPFACGDSILFDNHWYATTQIGGQCWFAENLRTTVYANGDTISTPIFDSDWYNANQNSTGSTVVYGHDSPYPWYGQMDCVMMYNSDTIVNGVNYCDPEITLNLYGRLYNYYAVLDERGICPSGWHVSSQTEYDELLDFLDDQLLNWTSLMSPDGWLYGDANSDGNYSNEFSFNAMPGGIVTDGGIQDFIGAGGWGVWWTSDAQPNSRQTVPSLPNSPALFSASHLPFGFGASVRCLKDPE